MKIIYILGSGHCGSTLLDIVLDGHSGIVGIGETDPIDYESVCTCGEPVKQCVLWSKVFDEATPETLEFYKTKIDFLLNKSKFYLAYGAERELFDKETYLDLSYKFYDSILKVSGVKLIVESTKNPYKVEFLAKSKKIEPIIIHLVRDGRAVSWSYIKKYGHPLLYMWIWFAQNIKIEIIRRKTGVKYIFVSYEKFTSDPKKVISEILEELGLIYEDGMLNFKNFTHHQMAGNRMRFAKTDEIKEDLDWRLKMPKSYVLIFNLLFGWFNYYYKKKKAYDKL